MTSKAEEYAWAYLIKHGTVIPRSPLHDGWSYYGGYYHEDTTGLRECLNGILTYGIDFEKSGGPRDNMHCKFTDTFNKPDDITVLEGTMYLNNGKSYVWGVIFDTGLSVFEMLEEMVTLGNIQEIVKLRIGEL